MSTILTLVGSLRSGSTNRQLAETAVEVAGENLDLSIYEGLADIPFYNEDIDVEGSVPEAATKLREAANAADAILFVTPEHNGTIPAVLKNAIDWLSRPHGASPLAGRPVAVIGTAYGQYGGVWAHDETRKALGIAGAAVLDDLKLAVPGSLVRFAETHPRDDSEVVAQLTDFLGTLSTAVSGTAAA